MDLEKEVAKRLEKYFDGAQWQIDFSDGKHMEILIIYGGFVGKSLLDQHKMVYTALNDLISVGWLHALKLKTKSQ